MGKTTEARIIYGAMSRRKMDNWKSCRDSTAEKIAEALGVTVKDLEEEKQPAAVQEANNG